MSAVVGRLSLHFSPRWESLREGRRTRRSGRVSFVSPDVPRAGFPEHRHDNRVCAHRPPNTIHPRRRERGGLASNSQRGLTSEGGGGGVTRKD